MQDSMNERCFLEATESKAKGLRWISRLGISLSPNWTPPWRHYCFHWPLPLAGHLQTTPSDTCTALKDAWPLARAKWPVIHSDPADQNG